MTELPFDDADTLAEQTEWLRALARRLVGDSHAAEDVVQETFLVALRQPSPGVGTEGGDRGSARAWLHGIVQNLARTARRSGARRSAREREYGAAQPQFSPGSDDVVERTARAGRLIAAVLALEEPYRTAVLLSYEERLDAPTIAARLGITPAAARKRISRGIEQLRARLGANRGGRSPAWLLGFAGRAAPKAAPKLPWITGLTMTMKWAPTIVAAAVLAGLGFWGWSEARSDASAEAGSTRVIASEEATRTVELADVSASAGRAEEGAAPSESAAPSKSGTQRTVLGRVLFSDDRTPVVGALIRANGRRGDEGTTPIGESLATTDSEGRFEVALDGPMASSLVDRGLWVQHDDAFDVHVDAAQISAFEGRVIEVRTVPLGSVTVHVVDAAGAPAIDVPIEYMLKPTLGSDAQLWTYQRDLQAGRTDAYGDVVVRGLPVSTLVRFGVQREYDKPARATIDPVTRRAEATLRLRGWATIAGQLEWPDGTPAVGVNVDWNGTSPSSGSMGGAGAVSGDDGAFAISDLSGGGGVLHFGSAAFHAPVPARIVRGEVTDVGTLTVVRPVRVAGRVILPEGLGAPKPLVVCALRDGVPVGQAYLEGSLDFELEVPPGPVVLALAKDLSWDPILPFRGEFMGTARVDAPQSDVELRLTAQVTQLKGTIQRLATSTGGQSTPELHLVPNDASVQMGMPHTLYGFAFEPIFRTDGTFSVVLGPVEDVRVLVLEGDRSAYTSATSIALNATNDVGALEWSQGEMNVLVTNALGAPLADAVVAARNVTRDLTEVRTDGEGVARFDLPVGPYAVRADFGGGASGPWRLVHVERNRVAEVEFSVEGEGILNGVVHSPNGPVAGVGIRAQCEWPISNLILAATTGADGSFRFKDVMPGRYRYSIGKELIGRVELEPGVPANLDLLVGAARETVTVTRGEKPTASVDSLFVSALGEGFAPWNIGEALGGGRFEVELPQGPLQFMLDLNGLGNNQLVLVKGPERDGATYRLDLPATGIELRLEGAAAHGPIPAAYLEELEGKPAVTFWGSEPELYAEDDGVRAGGVRVVRFPYIDGNARVRIEGLDAEGARRVETVRVQASGMTQVRFQ